MATVLQPARAGRSADYGYALYVSLHLTGFFVTTMLMTWGLFVLFFLAIGGFSLDGMMNHVQNLTSRYLAADAANSARIIDFKMVLFEVHFVLSAAIMVFRRHAILPREAGRQERPA